MQTMSTSVEFAGGIPMVAPAKVAGMAEDYSPICFGLKIKTPDARSLRQSALCYEALTKKDLFIIITVCR
jgi:hypothetical protein